MKLNSTHYYFDKVLIASGFMEKRGLFKMLYIMDMMT
jgi:hypothetical protein